MLASTVSLYESSLTLVTIASGGARHSSGWIARQKGLTYNAPVDGAEISRVGRDRAAPGGRRGGGRVRPVERPDCRRRPRGRRRTAGPRARVVRARRTALRSCEPRETTVRARLRPH